MIFLKSRERIGDSPGNPEQVLGSPPHSCIHQIISPWTARLSAVIEWLIPLYAFACLRCCSPLFRTSFPCSCLFFFLIVVWGVWCWHCCWSLCRLCVCLSTQSLTWPLMNRLPAAPEQKVMRGHLSIHSFAQFPWVSLQDYAHVCRTRLNLASHQIVLRYLLQAGS